MRCWDGTSVNPIYFSRARARALLILVMLHYVHAHARAMIQYSHYLDVLQWLKKSEVSWRWSMTLARVLIILLRYLEIVTLQRDCSRNKVSLSWGWRENYSQNSVLLGSWLSASVLEPTHNKRAWFLLDTLRHDEVSAWQKEVETGQVRSSANAWSSRV